MWSAEAHTVLLGVVVMTTLIMCSSSTDVIDDGSATAYNLFVYEFEASAVFSTDVDESVAVDYTPSWMSSPGLPTWLTYTQTDSSPSTGFMYGTPSNAEVGVQSFKVIALNKETYETAVRLFKVDTSANNNTPLYRLTLLVLNLDLVDVLNSTDIRDSLITVTENWWPVDDLLVVSVMSQVDGGGRYLPPGENEGVYVELGSASEFSDDINLLAEDFVNCSTTVPAPANNTDTLGFVFDWCSVNIETILDAPSTTPASDDISNTNVSLGPGSFTPREKGTEVKDMTVDFCITVFVPLGIALILFIILSYIMFGRREGLRKRLANTPNNLLTQHSAIKRATGELRHMSNTRIPKSPSSAVTTPSMNASRSSKDTPPTVKSKPKATPPPPYRCPRIVSHEGGDSHPNQETSFSQNAATTMLNSDSTGLLLQSPTTGQRHV